MYDIRNLDLNLLKTLDALLDERNVTRAADRLGLTQPAVSGLLARLRDSFDDPLFIRTQHGIIPTPRALEAAVPVKQVLADIQALMKKDSFDPATARCTLSVAGTDYAQQVILVPFIAALRERAPHMRVVAHPVIEDRVRVQLERGQLDIALMTPQWAPDDMHTERLFDEDYACAMRDDHPALSAGATLTLKQFCELDHALVSYYGEAFRGVTDEALSKLGKQRHVALSVTSFLVLLEILRSSDLIAVVPKRLLAKAPGIACIKPPLKIPGFTKIAVWHERTHHDEGQRWARAQLLEICAKQR